MGERFQLEKLSQQPITFNLFANWPRLRLKNRRNSTVPRSEKNTRFQTIDSSISKGASLYVLYVDIKKNSGDAYTSNCLKRQSLVYIFKKTYLGASCGSVTHLRASFIIYRQLPTFLLPTKLPQLLLRRFPNYRGRNYKTKTRKAQSKLIMIYPQKLGVTVGSPRKHLGVFLVYCDYRPVLSHSELVGISMVLPLLLGD